ncbi:MAG: hypothetical protein RI883_1412 [Bacteroidota bacterium]|jgi:hypothetical protein
MNWGKGIIIAMALFIGFITFLVISLVSHTIDLESEDYYTKEINYEQEITALENGNKLNDKIVVLSQKEFVVVQIPEKENLSKIQIIFIRPDNKKLDKSYLISGTKSYLIPKTELTKGTYNIEIRFENNKTTCLQKETIII